MYLFSIHMDVNNIQFTKTEIRIVIYLFKHYKDRHNARQLAKILSINHAHANKLCNSLTQKQLLIKEVMGNAIYFSFNYENTLAIKFMTYLLSLEEQKFPRWLVVLIHALKKFKPFIELGLVFGSSIKNKDFHDIDIFLMYRHHKKKEIDKIKEEIRKSQLVHEPIRYLDLTEKDIVSHKEDKVVYRIISDNLLFHSPEKYVEMIKKCHK